MQRGRRGRRCREEGGGGSAERKEGRRCREEGGRGRRSGEVGVVMLDSIGDQLLFLFLPSWVEALQKAVQMEYLGTCISPVPPSPVEHHDAATI